MPVRPFADRRRKTIAVIQSVALIIALVPATSSSWAAGFCAVALGLLAYSFAADILLLLSTGARKSVQIGLPKKRFAHHMVGGAKEIECARVYDQ